MRHEESLEQRAVVQWADMMRWGDLPLPIGAYLFAIPNGGKRGKIEAAIMKAEGVRAGMLDLMLAVPVHPHHGLYVEMKRRKGGRVSDAQEDWIERLGSMGYKTAVCRGADEARQAILGYLGGAL